MTVVLLKRRNSKHKDTHTGRMLDNDSSYAAKELEPDGKLEDRPGIDPALAPSRGSMALPQTSASRPEGQ